MESVADLIQRLIRLAGSKSAATFYLNGPAGSGKSYLLERLAVDLSAELPRSESLGPFTINPSQADSLGHLIMQECFEAGFLDRLPQAHEMHSLVSTWRWFGENAHVGRGHSFLVFIDIATENQLDLPELGRVFSNARHLEGAWNLGGVRVLHCIASYWDNPALERHFREINTSFPFTVGHNYLSWQGLDEAEFVQMVGRRRHGEASQLHGQLLFGLTGGHPSVALEILDLIPPGGLSLQALLSSTHQAAMSSTAGQALLRQWQELPLESRSLLKRLLFQRRIAAESSPSEVERLLAAGILRREQIAERHYLRFRSWYVELLVRLHAQDLGIEDDQTQRIDVGELMPEVSAISVEAYRLISDIETAGRNFVTIQLCLQREDASRHILSDKGLKYDNHSGAFEDAYERARGWRNRSAEGGLPVSLNPLLAYCSTRDLADLIDEIGRGMDSPAWQRIAQAIRDLSYVRDAVMHNQCIDDNALQQLYDLQADIHEALDGIR